MTSARHLFPRGKVTGCISDVGGPKGATFGQLLIYINDIYLHGDISLLYICLKLFCTE
jgi:hypothetical protein